jgi:hypothetical protein
VAGVAAAGGGAGGVSGSGGAAACDSSVDLFPVPVSDATTLFDEADDGMLEVPFGLGFSFSFFGTTYDRIFLNTNGGMTFGEGVTYWGDVLVSSMEVPAIGVLWSDLAADSNGADQRPNQMSYQQCPDRFVVRYLAIQDWLNADQHSTATATLFADGTIEIQYGEVLGDAFFVGVIDGTRTDDRTPSLPLQDSYAYYPGAGTGTIVFQLSQTHSGELSNRTITFLAQ